MIHRLVLPSPREIDHFSPKDILCFFSANNGQQISIAACRSLAIIRLSRSFLEIMQPTGQSLVDRLLAAKNTIAGQALAKVVCKATTEEIMGPKRKHLDCE